MFMLLKAWFLCKKPYIDILEYVNGEGNKIHDQHVIMKGFPTSCIEYFGNEKEMSVLVVFKELYDNICVYIYIYIYIYIHINIDLTNQSTNCVFRNTPGYNVK